MDVSSFFLYYSIIRENVHKHWKKGGRGLRRGKEEGEGRRGERGGVGSVPAWRRAIDNPFKSNVTGGHVTGTRLLL